MIILEERKGLLPTAPIQIKALKSGENNLSSLNNSTCYTRTTANTQQRRSMHMVCWKTYYNFNTCTYMIYTGKTEALGSLLTAMNTYKLLPQINYNQPNIFLLLPVLRVYVATRSPSLLSNSPVQYAGPPIVWSWLTSQPSVPCKGILL